MRGEGVNEKSMAKPLYIINSAGIAYHQHGVLYLIKPQEDARWRVMRYKGGLPPLMIYTTLRAAMRYQACGLDKTMKTEPIRVRFKPKSRHSRGWNPQFSAVWNQCEALYGIKPQRNTPSVMPCAFGNSMHANA